MVSGLPVVQSSRKVQALSVPQVRIGHSHLWENDCAYGPRSVFCIDVRDRAD